MTVIERSSIDAAPPKLESHPVFGWFFNFDRRLREPNPRDAGRAGNSRRMRRACERIRACKREDREIPAASTI